MQMVAKSRRPLLPLLIITSTIFLYMENVNNHSTSRSFGDLDALENGPLDLWARFPEGRLEKVAR